MRPISIILALSLAVTAAACDRWKSKPQTPSPAPKIALDVRSRARTAPFVHVIIRLNIGAAASATDAGVRARAIESASGSIMRKVPAEQMVVSHLYRIVPIMSAQVSDEGLDILERLVEVEEVVVDRDDRAFLDNSVNIIAANKVWPASTGTSYVVAVIDSGIHSSHPFLAGKIAFEACFSVERRCPNNSTEQRGAGAAQSLRKHGTHVAGIAAGANGLAGQLKGVAHGARIIAINIFSGEIAYESDQIAALEYVEELKMANVRVVAANMSLGGQVPYKHACDATETSRKVIIDRLHALGVATVIAAGNNGWNNAVAAPGCISSAVTVSSISDQGAIKHNRSIVTDLAAPGIDIWSAKAHAGNYSNVPADYMKMDGTSMAAPHIAGAITLLARAEPSASIDQILRALVDTARETKDIQTGRKYKIIVLDRALAKLREFV